MNLEPAVNLPRDGRAGVLDLSVVAPLFDEEASVRALYRAITTALDSKGMDYEVIFVDDGSRDGTFARAAEIARSDRRLRVVKFRRNYGQTPAMAAGIEHARGRVVVTMDGDLQNDPADIPRLLRKLDEGYDLVVGWRYKRKDALITRKIPSKIANWLIGKVTGVPIKDNGCSLKAYRAPVICRVPLYSEMHRFIPAMASITGARVAELQVRHHARRFGASKYGLSRIYKVLIDLLTIKTIVSFATRPALWFSVLALPPFIAGSFLGVITAADVAGGGPLSLPVAGSSVLLISLTFFLLFCGVIAELVYKTGSLKVPRLALLTAGIRKDRRTNDEKTAPPEICAGGVPSQS